MKSQSFMSVLLLCLLLASNAARASGGNDLYPITNLEWLAVKGQFRCDPLRGSEFAIAVEAEAPDTIRLVVAYKKDSLVNEVYKEQNLKMCKQGIMEIARSKKWNWVKFEEEWRKY